MNSVLKKNIYIKNVFIPVALFLLGIALMWLHLIFSPYSYTVTISSHPSVLKQYEGQKLQVGKKISQVVTAAEDNMGIVTIRFFTKDQKVRSMLAFRIKEYGAREWYYENDYDTRQFFALPFYPFGFPPISNSKNKNYIVEIEAKSDLPSPIYISAIEPNFVLSYQHSKAEVLRDARSFINFALFKLINAVRYMDMVFAMLIYFLPLLFYVLWNVALGKYVSFKVHSSRASASIKLVDHLYILKYSWLFRSILLLVMFIDVFYIKTHYDLFIIVISIIWIYLSYLYKISSIFYLRLVLLFILIGVFTNMYSTLVTGKLFSWIFVFSLIATALTYTEARSKI